MANFYPPYKNKTMELYDTLNTILYFCGLRDFWVEEVKLPAKFLKFYNRIKYLIEFVMFSFLAMEIGAFFTQDKLSIKQTDDLRLFVIAHSFLYVYVFNMLYYKKKVRFVLQMLAVDMKKVYNDEELEEPQARRLKLYILAYVASTGVAIVLYATNAITQYIKSRAPLTTVITAWPDVTDDSGPAQVFRIISLIIWIVYFYRVSGSFVIIISLLICLRFQYLNLQSYFRHISGIFEKDRGRAELEREYESALKVGVKLHQDTLGCVEECRKINGFVFSAQTIYSLAELVAIISQMVTSERTLVNVVNTLTMALSVMIMAGFVFWNAGDVTVEASNLSAAMYGSGWQNCAGPSSARVRRLLALAMLQAQRPVDFMALGCVTMSYETYLAICKSSYSVFSVMI